MKEELMTKVVQQMLPYPDNGMVLLWTTRRLRTT